MRYSIIPHDHPMYPAIKRRLFVTWCKTLLGYLAMCGLVYVAYKGFGSVYEFKFGLGTLWLALPIVIWWWSHKLAIWMTKSVPADPSNPVHKRLLDIVDRVYPKSGLKFKPPVYISPNPVPNAFATGPIHRRAVVAATEGLFQCGMTDDEIEAVFAHELGHVKNYDVAINSFLGVISSLFFLIVDAGVRVILGTIGFFKKSVGLRQEQRILPAILTNIIFYAIFWVTGQFTRVIQFFVVRSRESCADATASLMTGQPCLLATALLKLVAYVEKNRPKAGRETELFRTLRTIMIIDPIFDSTEEPKKGGVWQSIKDFWKRLQLTHPPVPERVAELERMNGGQCPRP